MTDQDVMGTAVRQEMRRLENDLRRADTEASYWVQRARIIERDFQSCIKFAAAGWVLATVALFFLLLSK